VSATRYTDVGIDSIKYFTTYVIPWTILWLHDPTVIVPRTMITQAGQEDITPGSAH